MADLTDILAPYLPGADANAMSRQTPDAQTNNALGQGYETRLYVLAEGLQFNEDPDDENYPPTYFEKNGFTITRLDTQTFMYVSDKQKVKYVVYVTRDKSEFRQALTIAGIGVLYMGHARHGMGPCFHVEDEAGEWWNDGDDETNGIFRMGYPYVAVPLTDINDNQWTPVLLPNDQDKPPQDTLKYHPKLLEKGNYGKIKKYAWDDLWIFVDDPNDTSTDGKKKKIKGKPDDSLKDRLGDEPYWGLECVGDSGKVELHLVLTAGWTGTSVTPSDLGGTDMACKVFIHFGCSSLIHNYPVVRDSNLYAWKKNGDDRICYWTNKVSLSLFWQLFLFYLFSYDKQNTLWEPSIKWAVKQTNDQVPSFTNGKKDCKLI